MRVVLEVDLQLTEPHKKHPRAATMDDLFQLWESGELDKFLESHAAGWAASRNLKTLSPAVTKWEVAEIQKSSPIGSFPGLVVKVAIDVFQHDPNSSV